MEQLILFRGLQGLGGGAIFPVALAVVADLYTPSERGKYLGLFGAVFGVSFLIGPAIGGLITDTVGWHWIFFVNVPIGLISLVIISRLLPAIKRPDAARNIDYLGAAVFAAAISLILIGLTNKGTGEWTDPAVGGLILAGLLITAVFIWIESRAEDPIVPLGLFRIRNFSVSVAAMFFAAFGFFGAVIFLPRWLQTVGGASATISGYNLLPLVGGLIVSATMSGQIVARTGKYKILMLVSLVMLAVGLVLMTNLTAETPRPVLWFWMVIAGLGIGPSFAVFTLVVQNSVNAARIGVATASLTFFQQIGGTIGLTLRGIAPGDPPRVRDPETARGGRRAPAGRGRVRRRRRGGPDRDGGSRPADPGQRPARSAASDRAVDPGDRPCHLRRVLGRDRGDVLGRRRRGGHRGHRGCLHARGADAHDLRLRRDGGLSGAGHRLSGPAPSTEAPR